MKKRLLSIILSITVLISMIPALSLPIFAADDNQIGDNVFWTFDSDTATLTVKGTGPTYDFDYDIFCKMLGLDIKHIVIEEGVTYIGNMCFQGCSIVEDVVFSNTVTAIGDLSFSGCSSITKLTIPGSLKTIGVSAFDGLYILSDLTIENGVETIKEYAFGGCDGLTNISIPASVSTIDSLFAGACDNLVSVTVDEQNEFFCSVDGVLYTKNLEKLLFVPYAKEGVLRVLDGVKTIGSHAISNEHLTGVYLPDTVEILESGSIGLYASCTELHLGNGLKTLCDSAIYSGGVSEIVLPASVEYIGVEAIQSFSSALKKVVVLSKDCEIAELNHALGDPSNVAIYGYEGSTAQALAEKYRYRFVIVDGTEYDKRIGDDVYWSFDSETSTLVIEGNGPTFDYSEEHRPGFKNMSDSVEHIVINDGVTYIGEWLFLDFKNAKDVSIPNTVTAIGNSAFARCFAISKLTIPGSVKTIGSNAFYQLINLTDLTIENGVETIESLAFYYCENLPTISIPASVLSVEIPFNAGGLKMMSVTVDEQNKNYCSVDGVLYTKNLEKLIYIPEGREGKLIVPSGVKAVCPDALNSVARLSGLYLPDTVETLESTSIFSDWLLELDLGAGIKTIADNAIYLGRVTEIVLPSSVEHIGADALYISCELKKVVVLSKDCEIDDSPNSLGNHHFSPDVVIYGSEGSTAQAYAEKYSYEFVVVGCGEGVHEYEKTEKPATCTEKGALIYACKNCGYTYSEETSALGHNYKGKTTRNPTCTAVGQTTYTCTRCNDSYSEDDIPALGHNYVAKTTAPTCTEKGYTTHTCSRCGDAYTDTYTNAVGHSYTETVVKPSCTGRGYTEHTCSRCGDSYQNEYVAALGHNYVDKTISPTCTEKGYVLHSCSRCDVTYTSDETAALGHDWDDGVVTLQPTETTTGVRTFTCKRCSETKTEVIPETDHVHAYTAVVTPPTCTEKGYTTHTCRCGESYVDTEVAALGHDYKAVVTEPTCTEVGYTTDTCSRCGDTKKHSEVAALGHNWDKGKDKKPASVFETGIKVYTCTRCKETREETIPKLSSCDGGSGCPTSAYLDIPAPKNWAHAGIDFCVHKGLMSSTSTEKLVFSPAEKTSRAMIVVILYRLEGSPKVSYKSVFDDVPNGRWFSEGIIWAQNNGIVTGYGNRKFGPNDVITREQLATIMRRYTTFKGYKTSQKANLSSFPDSKSVSGWAQGGVAWAVKFGLINGKGTSSGTILDPKGYATRAETATILMRYIQRQDELELLSAPVDCAHDWERVSTQSATCTKEGLATYQCFACGSDYTETLPKTDHKYSKKTTAPTCTAGGYDTYTCSVCGYSYTTNKTSALGHNYVNGSCTRCGAKDPNSGTGKELTTEEVYAKCSPAVFTIYTYDEYGYPIAQGSGFFVSSNGVAVTNAHVVEDADGVKIILSDGRTLWADSLIGGDSAEDWAVLKVNVTGVPYLSIGSRSTAVGGTSIYTIGSPKGMNNTISTGIISNPNRLWNGVSYIQITAPISPGSSGGALINKYGQVIGITTAQFYPSSGNDLYGAVPIQYAAATLRKYGVSCPD